MEASCGTALRERGVAVTVGDKILLSVTRSTLSQSRVFSDLSFLTTSLMILSVPLEG